MKTEDLRNGCVYHEKRWSGDTHADLGGTVNEAETDLLMEQAADEIDRLRRELEEERGFRGEWCHRARRACAERDLLDSLYTKVAVACLKCDPIPACEREDDTLEPPWEVIDRIRKDRDHLCRLLEEADHYVHCCPFKARIRSALEAISRPCKNAIDTTTPDSQTPQPHDTHD